MDNQYDYAHYDVRTKGNDENNILIGLFSDKNWLNIKGVKDERGMTLYFGFVSKDKNNCEMEINRASNQFSQPIIRKLYEKLNAEILIGDKKTVITDQADSINSMSIECTEERCRLTFDSSDRDGEVLISSKSKKLSLVDSNRFLVELLKIATPFGYDAAKAKFLYQYINQSNDSEKII